MTDEVVEVDDPVVDCCPICLNEIANKCRTECDHDFCKHCILRVLQPHGSSLCPYCRASISVFEITVVDDNKPLLSKQPATLSGSVYIQCNTNGLASYHFKSLEDCYISYESPACLHWPDLDDGSRPSQKKPFINPSFNEASRTFTGQINWNPTTWRGDQSWYYEMLFSEDFDSIIGGQVEAYDSEGNPTRTHRFGVHLSYQRLYDSLSIINAQ